MMLLTVTVNYFCGLLIDRSEGKLRRTVCMVAGVSLSLGFLFYFKYFGFFSDVVSGLLGRENPYTHVFDPSRSMLHPQLAVNGWESALHLLKPTGPRCPHLGCALEWNPREQSWDCPCHGSRFSEAGELLENPAKRDLNRK